MTDGRHIFLGLSLAYLGRKEEAIREGERAVATDPVSKDAYGGFYIQHQLARIYMLVGEPEKALDQLEPLLKIPYYISRDASRQPASALTANRASPGPAIRPATLPSRGESMNCRNAVFHL